jgi:hypothetical protein
MANTETLRQKLEAKKKLLDEKIRRLNAREGDKRRRDDTRRKIIVGALAIAHAEHAENEDFKRTLYGLVSRYTVKPQDRALFGLEALDAPAESELEANAQHG